MSETSPGGEATSRDLREERDEFRDALRGFFAATSPESEVRRLMDTEHGYDRDVWTRMADQLGLQGLVIPEELGGSGFTLVEMAVALEEMGRVLLCAPYFSSVVLAANLLLATDDHEAKRRFLPGIADGSTIATVALAEASGRWDADAVTVAATRSEASWTVTGEKLYVLDGHTADLVLVVARTPSGVSIFAVEKGSDGLTATALETLDPTRKQARVVFDETPASLVGMEGRGWTAVATMLELAAVALAAEQAGGARKVLELSVDYAKARVQFGRPIGSFQAIKHKLADLLVEVESARSAVLSAAQAIADRSDEISLVASVAKAYCSEAFSHAAAESIHVHGGVGFTWEHPAHLYFRRAHTSEVLFGSPAEHRERLARGLLTVDT